MVKALRLRARHGVLEERLDLGLVVDPPARKEGRKRQFGEHRDFSAGGGRSFQKRDEPVHRLGALRALLDRACLADRDGQVSSHGVVSLIGRFQAAAVTMISTR